MSRPLQAAWLAGVALAFAWGCADSSAIHDGEDYVTGEGGRNPDGPSATQGPGGAGGEGPSGPGVGGGGPGCGDGNCSPTETCGTCPDDCGACGPMCGDGFCDDPIESCNDCPGDCGSCSVCGDGVCAADEDCQLCYQDCGVCACAPDGFEPNQQSPSATPVASGTDYCDLSVCGGDVDWLEFDILHGLTATITFHEGEGDLDLEIYSAQTIDYVSGSYSSDDDESITLSGLPTGTYWARIYGKGGATNPFYCFRVDAN